ncbi:alpha/beta fold hydrolase [Dehalococcoides mccartyi]|nr:alpha/beta fold hydrolase [Dehalococcoides mccartyi]
MLRSKLVRFLLLPLVALTLLVILGGGWYFSSVLEEDGLRVNNSDPENSVVVVDISVGSISLRQLPDAEEQDMLATSARWGLSDGLNYGQLRNVISDVDGVITRELELNIGGFQIGDELFLDRSATPHQPHVALRHEDVVISGPIGQFGAWYLLSPNHGKYEGDISDTWAIYVHGRTSNKDATLKSLGAGGIPSLAIDYRNDIDAPPSESGYYDFGTTEWRDVEAAVQYALDNGAKKIILVGYSMGGGVVVNYQLRSELAEHTVAMILEAPMLNFGRTVDKGAEERGVPAPITFAAKRFATMRFGVDWDALDFLSRADEINVPVLLIHGEADETVPVETSIEFAEALPGLVELHTFPEVGHVTAWNWHPTEYNTLVREFIERFR